MDAGNAAQWAAVTTALALGIRAVRDRRREHAREEGAAFAQAMAEL